jgi:hypothetical protein
MPAPAYGLGQHAPPAARYTFIGRCYTLLAGIQVYYLLQAACVLQQRCILNGVVCRHGAAELASCLAQTPTAS